MNASTPLEIDGKTFPFYSLNLAISTRYNDGREEGNAAMRLVPTRIDDDGNVETSEENAKPVLLGTMANLQDPEKTAVEVIQTALQTYIYTKGL